MTYIYPTEAVTVDLGDGKPRELRYNLGTLRRLKAKFGKSALTGELLQSLDEDKLPELLYEGLVDKSDIANADALAEMIPAAAVPYLIQQFVAAYSGAFPKEPEHQKNDQSSPLLN